jgi:DNA-binding IclR family transcriptional regulator
MVTVFVAELRTVSKPRLPWSLSLVPGQCTVFHIMNASFKDGSAATIPGTQAIRRVLSLLKAFTEEKPRRSLTELAAAVGLNKATAHRMLGVLEREGFVVRTPAGSEFQLGPELIVLGSRALRGVDIREAARPYLRALAEETGEDATLESLAGDEVLILDEIRGRSLLSLGTEIGTRWPTHATATGKVLAAFVEPALREPDGGLPPITDHTIVSWDAWTRTLSQVREKGYATNLEELEYGYASAAAPVRDGEGRVVAALSVGGSVHRVTRGRIPELVKSVREAASRLSGRLGYRPGSAQAGPLPANPNPESAG